MGLISSIKDALSRENFETPDRRDSLARTLEQEYDWQHKDSDSKTELNINRVGEQTYEYEINNHIPEKMGTDTYTGTAEYDGSDWNITDKDKDISF